MFPVLFCRFHIHVVFYFTSCFCLLPWLSSCCFFLQSTCLYFPHPSVLSSVFVCPHWVFYLPPHFFCFLSVFVQWNWLFHIKACLLLVLSASLKYCICLRSVLKHTQPESVNIWHHLRPQGLSLDTLWQHFPASDAWPKQYAPSDDHTSNWINATRTNMAARFGNFLLYYKK